MVKSSFGPEKILHQGSAFFLQNTSGQLGFWMKRPAWKDCFRFTAAVSILFVFGPIYHAADLAPVQGARTHQAGVYGNIDSCFREVFAAEMVEGRGEREDLRVSGAVGKPFRLVMAAGVDAFPHHDSGSYRHSACSLR